MNTLPMILRSVLILMLFAGGRTWAQSNLFPAPRLEPRFPEQPNHPFYVNARYFARQTGYEDLWRRHRGHLPTGKGVVVAQVENGVADAAQFKDKHFVFVPDFKPTKSAAGHENTTGKILYSSTPYSNQQATFEYGFSPGVTMVLAFTSGQFRTQVLKLPSHNTRGGVAPGWNGPSAEVLNLSNTLGNGGEQNTVRSLDALIDTANTLAFTSQPGSLKRNESVAGVLWNSVVVGKASPDLGYAEGAVYENVGPVPRPKPDLVSASYIHRDGGASSWSTPTVASGAALLLERARATPATHPATNNYVMKAILLAGATKTGLFSPVYDAQGTLVNVDFNKPWQWTQSPTAPLDKFSGAGNFNLNHAYAILEAGEQSQLVTGAAAGWAWGRGLTATGKAHQYAFTVTRPAVEFSAVLVWNRHLKDVGGKSFDPLVANLVLELWSADPQQRLAWSDDPGNNVEHVWLGRGLKPGRYFLRVASHADLAENYGLAWRATPAGL